ncbi:MAG: efflux RND transporter periplasmic adaptor subunit [Pseudomonadales bacterium]
MNWIERIGHLQPRPLWFFPPVILGVIIFLVSNLLAPGVQRTDAEPLPVPVRLLSIERMSITPWLTGYGEVRPNKTWRAVAQVPGRIVYRHPALEPGAMLEAGIRVLEIDPRDYELALKRAIAEQRSAEARLAELDARKQDLRTSINIERQALQVAARDFDRKENLVRDNHVSALELDAEKQKLLRQRQNVQNLEAQINLLPAQRAALEAAQSQAEAQVARAREDLERAKISMPFNGRITEVNIEQQQFSPAGQTLLVAESLDAMEVHLEVPLESIVSRFPDIVSEDGIVSSRKQILNADISYASGDLSMEWEGHVKRIDPGLNPETRAARIYVHIDTEASTMPPQANLYARVQISGPVLEEQIVIPRVAWHDGFVYLADGDNKLVKQPVSVAFREGDRMVIASGLEPGDQLILTDIPYAVDGIRVIEANADEQDLAP